MLTKIALVIGALAMIVTALADCWILFMLNAVFFVFNIYRLVNE